MPVSSGQFSATKVLALLLAACSNPTGPSGTPGPAACGSSPPVQLGAGAHLVIDPVATAGCVRLPAAGPAGAQHVLMAFSGSGEVTPTGLSAPYVVTGQVAGAMASGRAQSSSGRMPVPLLSPAQQFHDLLRERGRALAAEGLAPNRRSGRLSSLAVAPPPAGSQRDFQVCGDHSCTAFVTVTATLKQVGPHGLLYLDDAAPAGGYTAADLTRLGALFDQFMYPIDTTAFGHETDLDANGSVIILLTPAVNHLSGNCNASGSVILGFFFPDDLEPGTAGSNGGEIFYGLVPDPNNSTCSISRSFVLGSIGPTFLHEFQHMISFGRHVVLANGASEDNWLDEGLSRLAEELGGREVPDSFCSPNTCFSTYPFGDLQNAFEYLQKDTLEASPLIEPGNVDGTLPENGANWLFTRWLADHFSTDTILGTSLTRGLDGADSPTGTDLTGADNVAAATGTEFPVLIGEWQLANFLTGISGFSEPTARLRYRSWNFGQVFPAAFGSYPLEPDTLVTGTYSHTGILHPGSGRHLLVIQPPSSGEVDVLLATPAGGQISATLVPRIAVARVR